MDPTVAELCRDAIVSALRTKGFARIDDDEIVARDQPQDWTHLPRGISVIPDGELEGAGTNEKDDYGYRFGVYWATGTGKEWSELQGVLPQWRRETRKLFNNKRLSGVTRNMICAVRSGNYLSDKSWQDNKAISALAIICWCRESREE